MKSDLERLKAENVDISNLFYFKDDCSCEDYIKEITSVKQTSFTVGANDTTKDVFYIAISGEEADKYIGLNNRKTIQKQLEYSLIQ